MTEINKRYKERQIMQKVEKIYIVLIAALTILLSGIAISYNVSDFYETTNVELCVQVESTQKDQYEIYYSMDNKGDQTVYTAEQCSVADLTAAGEKQELHFKVAAGTNIIRFDPGSQGAIIKIYGITLKYKDIIVELPLDKLSNFVASYCVKAEAFDEGVLYLETVDGDPYVAMDIMQWNNMKEVVRDSNRNVYRCYKVLVIILFILLAFLMIKKRKEILSYFKNIYTNRKLIWSLSKNDFKTKYAGSYLGIFWAFVQPIVTVCVYWFVFSVGLRAGKVSKVPYALWLVSGLVPWFFFNDALMGGTNALLEYNYLVKKVVFNIDILPIVKTISACFVHLFFVFFTIIMYAVSGYYPDIYYLQLIYYSICTFALVLALVYITCAVVVFFRDLTQIINIFLQIGIWMTPIMWQMDILPESLKWIFYLNPVYYVVLGYRDSLIDKISIYQRWGMTLYFWVIVLLLFAVGTKLFKKLQTHFADVL